MCWWNCLSHFYFIDFFIYLLFYDLWLSSHASFCEHLFLCCYKQNWFGSLLIIFCTMQTVILTSKPFNSLNFNSIWNFWEFLPISVLLFIYFCLCSVSTRSPWRSSKDQNKEHLTSWSRWAPKTLPLNSPIMTGSSSPPCMRCKFKIWRQHVETLRSIWIFKKSAFFRFSRTSKVFSKPTVAPLIVSSQWEPIENVLWSVLFCCYKLNKDKCCSSGLSPPPGGAYPLRVWSSQIPWCHHSQPGAVCAAVQRGAALGGDGAVPLRGPG